jgi:hypothetical protein
MGYGIDYLLLCAGDGRAHATDTTDRADAVAGTGAFRLLGR